MYIAKTDFEKVLLWYERSTYKAMLIFCSGFNPRDREITKQIAYNKDYIDRTTGDGVCYLFFDAVDSTDGVMNLSDIQHVAGIQNIYQDSSHNANIKVTDDICKQFDILSSELPALILVRHRNKADVFPIESYTTIETFVYASRLVGDCYGAIDSVNKEISALSSSILDKQWEITKLQNNYEKTIHEIDKIKLSISEDYKKIDKCKSALVNLQSDGYNVLHDIVSKTHDAVVELINSITLKIPKESYMSELYTSPDKYSYIIDYYGLFQDEAILDVCNKIQKQLDVWNLFTGVRIAKYMPHPSNREYEKRLTDCLTKAIDGLKLKINNLSRIIENSENKIITSKNEANKIQIMLQKADVSFLALKKSLEAKEVVLTEKAERIVAKYADKTSRDLFLDESSTKNIYSGFLAKGSNVFSIVLSSLFQSISERNIPFTRKLQELKSKIEAHDFDIFISCKSEDYSNANDLFGFLEKNGFKPFMADPFMREFGHDVYDDTIREVIKICNTMIVFATDVAYLSASKVHEEWSIFSSEVSTGRKNGKLLTLVSPQIHPDDLPIGLHHLECFTTVNYKESLIPYIIGSSLINHTKKESMVNVTGSSSSSWLKTVIRMIFKI